MPPQENPQAVANFIIWLNRTYPPGPWVALGGFTAMKSANPLADGFVDFNRNSGFILKSFRNNGTGEVKSFEASRFYV